MRYVLATLLVVCLGIFAYDYWEIRKAAICAHTNVVHLEQRQ